MYLNKSGKNLMLVITLLALSLFISCIVAAAGEQPVKVEVNGKLITFDVQPVIEKERTLVPLRGIFEALGAEVKWDGKTKTVTAVKDDNKAKLTIGSKVAYKNNEEFTLNVPAKIINDRTFVPLRFISESLGAKVKWDGTAKLVSISSSSAGSGGILKKVTEKVAEAVEKILKPGEEVAEKPKEEKQKETPRASGGGGGGGGGKAKPPTEITITDSNGKKITIPQPLERVVVLNSDIATVIKILRAQDKVVGVSDIVAKKVFLGMTDKPKVGDWYKNPNLEKIVELNPQVVFTYGKWPGDVLEKNLEPLNIKVVRINCYIPNTLDSDFKIVARMFGKEKIIDEFFKWKNCATKVLAERTSGLKPEQKVRVFSISSSKLAKGQWSTYGKGTANHEGILMAGAINVAGELEGYKKVDPSWILSQNPDVLLIPCFCGELGYDAKDYSNAERVKESVLNNEVLKNIDAVKNGRVYLISSRLLGGINTPFGALYLARWFYPERFKDINPERVYREYFERWLGSEFKGKWSCPPA